jgi:hypothetical protein
MYAILVFLVWLNIFKDLPRCLIESLKMILREIFHINPNIRKGSQAYRRLTIDYAARLFVCIQ